MGFLGVAKKDVRLLLARPRDLMINIAVPLAMAILFGYLYSPKGGPASKIEVGAIDLDQSAASKGLITSLASEETLEVKRLGEAEARALIEQGKLTAAVVLPRGFAEELNVTALFKKEKPTLTLLVDPSQSMSYQIIEGLLTKNIMMRLGGNLLQPGPGRKQLALALADVDNWDSSEGDKARWRSFFETGIEAMGAGSDAAATGAVGADASAGPGGGGFELPMQVKTEPVVRTGGRFSAYAHSFAGMLVMFLFFVAIDGGISVIDERRRGTWRRLRTAPIGRSTLLASKVAQTFVQALIVSAVLFGVGILFFGVRINGSLPGFLAVMVMSALTAAAFGLMLMGLGRTEGQVRGYAMFAVLLMAFLGGAWFPAWMLPDWLRTVAMAVPTSWMMEAFYATTWRGLGFEAIARPLLALCGFVVVFGAIGLKSFRWDE